MPKKSSYQKLKEERDLFEEEIITLVQASDSMDAQMIKIKWREILVQRNIFIIDKLDDKPRQ